MQDPPAESKASFYGRNIRNGPKALIQIEYWKTRIHIFSIDEKIILLLWSKYYKLHNQCQQNIIFQD